VVLHSPFEILYSLDLHNNDQIRYIFDLHWHPMTHPQQCMTIKCWCFHTIYTFSW